MKKPVRIAVTGAAGNIGYAIAFRIASGSLFGADQPVILHLIEIEPALPALRGVEMELDDCAFPLLHGVVVTSELETGFGDIDYAFLIGSRPRSKGMERSDLLSANGAIFKPQGEALSAHAKRDVRVLVVGNPANTNALIALHNAPNLQPHQITSMMRLDHNRSVSMLARKLGKHSSTISCMTVWGNHSLSQVPDIQHARVDGVPATELVEDAWYRDEFVPRIQRRGAEVIEARGASSAASAASAAIDHMRDWILGSATNDWVSMGILSDGHYGIEKDLMYSYPITTADGRYQIVEDLSLTPYSVELIKISEAELIKERDAVRELI